MCVVQKKQPKLRLGPHPALSNSVHSGIETVLRPRYRPDTVLGIKNRKVTRTHEVPAIVELKSKSTSVS